ncbi:uncharacterized protein An07g00180 [Aspergillus niger]|uniref:Contig An07c0010, genomic contig n=2 Tax=Aspergillus niger TaxID=5061 RepID=A2QLY8_ASPNC|nr:uncharacterized protein An07g00180 [Aspergillus niger]CAK39242.1 unnamed protein product [Aspergillus niger]
MGIRQNGAGEYTAVNPIKTTNQVYISIYIHDNSDWSDSYTRLRTCGHLRLISIGTSQASSTPASAHANTLRLLSAYLMIKRPTHAPD